jgi:hypothetical protein
VNKRIFSIIIAFVVMIVLTVSLATPAMAAQMTLGKEANKAGEPTHPTDVYLAGMVVHYDLSVRNDHPTNSVTELAVSDKEPGIGVYEGPVVGLDAGIDLVPGASWTHVYPYTVAANDFEPAVLPPAGYPENVVVNTLIATGYQGIEHFNLNITKTVYIASPSIKVTKTVDKSDVEVGDTVNYTIKIENTGDWPLSKTTILSGYGVDDSVMGDISGYFTTDPLPIGGSEERTIPYQIPNADHNPLENIVTATYYANGFNPEITGATVSDEDNAIVNLIEPSTKVTIQVSPKQLPAEGGKVDITVREQNDGTGVDLEDVFVHVVANSAFFADLDFSTPPSTFTGGNADNILSPGETWEWVIHDVEITEETLFEATGNGYYGEAPNRVNVTFPPDNGEYDYDTVTLNPPVEAPGISNTGMYLLIAGFAGIITIFVYRRARVSKQ